MTPQQLAGLHNLAENRRAAAERGLVHMSDADLRDVVFGAKPNTVLAELATVECLVRGCCHLDLDQALARVELTNSVDILRRAWRRESDGKRRVLLLCAMEARGREVQRAEKARGKPGSESAPLGQRAPAPSALPTDCAGVPAQSGAADSSAGTPAVESRKAGAGETRHPGGVAGAAPRTGAMESC